MLGGVETSPPVWMLGEPSQLVLGKKSRHCYPQVLVLQTATKAWSRYARGYFITPQCLNIFLVSAVSVSRHCSA